MEYRREIDGLRALAVLSVIFFHAGFTVFSGGYVGVDVFFVISGFLITKIILKELEQGQFSIAHFYERRARRILPALFLVLLVSLPLAWFLLMPREMNFFAQSLAAVSIFASNILFWRESGYFGPAGELKPLLHTWSLAVEEQYYLLFPVVMLVAWRFGKRWVLGLLVAAFAASFVLAHNFSVSKPYAAFFLLPTRGWELLVGALAAFFVSQKNRPTIPQGVAEFGGWVGLALIAYAVFVYDEETPFPGVYALLPTLGAMLIILLAHETTTVGRVLGHRICVGIGLISYSAYLWHQPIFAFARHYGLMAHQKLEFFGLIILTLLLAAASWKFVETPFRRPNVISRSSVFLFSLLGTSAFLLIGLYGHLNAGDVGQINQQQRQFLSQFENDIPDWNYFEKHGLLAKYRTDCDFYDLAKFRQSKATKVPVAAISESCFKSDKDPSKIIFIWGDSHAQQFNYGVRQSFPNDFDVLQVASSGCAAKLDGKPDRTNYCAYSNWFALETIKKLKPGYVLVAQRSGHNSADMSRIAQALVEAGVGRVIFLGPVPRWRPFLPNVIAGRLMPDVPSRTFVGVDRETLLTDKKLKEDFRNLPGVSYISVVDYFCNQEGCIVYFGSDVSTGITTWDYGHLSPIASYQFVRDVLKPQLERTD